MKDEEMAAARLARAGEAGEIGEAGEAQQCSDETTNTEQAKASSEQAKASSFASLQSRSERHATALVPDSQAPLLPSMLGLWQLTLHWQPSEQQQEQLQKLYALTLAGNRQFNLTRITEPAEFWEKHLWDSLRGVQRFLLEVGQAGGRRKKAEEVEEAEEAEEAGAGEADKTLLTPHSSLLTPHFSFKVIDIGTGAGFPGLPVAIAQPHWTVTLLDATRKKVTFLDQVLVHMGLTNATTLVERVEQVGRQRHQRQTYNLALIRAVAAATVCAEYALPLLKIGGYAVLYRGQWTDAETASMEAAVAVLGGKIDMIEAFTTPLTQGDRHYIYLKKIAPTPNEFPRAIGIPAQKPLSLQDGTEDA